MSRLSTVIRSQSDRETVAKWARDAAWGTRVEFKEGRRSLAQNSRLHACLGEVASQLPWHGLTLTSQDWKLIFLDALKREMRIVPNIDGDGFVNLGRSSSDLSKAEMTELLELIVAWGTQHGVIFHDGQEHAA